MKPYGGTRFTAILLVVLLIFLFAEVNDAYRYSDAPDVVEVPIVLDLSGDRADEGNAYLRGIEIAIDDFNSNGMRQFVPVVYDTGGSLDKMKECFDDIMSKGYAFMLGPMDAEEADLIAHTDYDICALTFSLSSSVFSDAERIYRSTITDGQYVNAIKTHIDGRYQSAAVLYDGSFESMHLMKDLLLELEDQKMDVEWILVDDPDDAAEELLDSSPQIAISILSAASRLDRILEIVSESDFKTEWLGLDSSVSDKVAASMDGFYAITTQRTITESSFVEKYEEKYGMYPDPKAMFGYDFMSIAAQIVNSDGSSYERFHEGISSIRYIGMTGFIKFNEKGDSYPTSNFVVSKDGKWEILSWKDILDL